MDEFVDVYCYYISAILMSGCFKANDCPIIAQRDDSKLILSSYNTSLGTNVFVECRKFANRYKGPSNITCYQNISWSHDGLNTIIPASYGCEWTGVLNTYEKVVLGVAAGAASFFVICLVSIVCLGCLSLDRRRSRKRKERYQHFDTAYGSRDKDGYSKDSGDFIRKTGPYSDRAQNEATSGMYASRINQETDRGLSHPDRQSDFYQSRITPYYPTYANDRRHDHKDEKGESDPYMGRQELKYSNRAFNENDAMNLHPVTTNRENYKWNGHIPRPYIGPSRREDSHAF